MTVAPDTLRKIKKEKLRTLLVPTEMINPQDPTGTAIMRMYKRKELKYLAWALSPHQNISRDSAMGSLSEAWCDALDQKIEDEEVKDSAAKADAANKKEADQEAKLQAKKDQNRLEKEENKTLFSAIYRGEMGDEDPSTLYMAPYDKPASFLAELPLKVASLIMMYSTPCTVGVDNGPSAYIKHVVRCSSVSRENMFLAPQILEAMWPELPDGKIGRQIKLNTTKIPSDRWPNNLLVDISGQKKGDLESIAKDVVPKEERKSWSGHGKTDFIAEILYAMRVTMRSHLRFPPYMLYTAAIDAPQVRLYGKALNSQSSGIDAAAKKDRLHAKREAERAETERIRAEQHRQNPPQSKAKKATRKEEPETPQKHDRKYVASRAATAAEERAEASAAQRRQAELKRQNEEAAGYVSSRLSTLNAAALTGSCPAPPKSFMNMVNEVARRGELARASDLLKIHEAGVTGQSRPHSCDLFRQFKGPCLGCAMDEEKPAADCTMHMCEFCCTNGLNPLGCQRHNRGRVPAAWSSSPSMPVIDLT
jgi:hypothetical protein